MKKLLLALLLLFACTSKAEEAVDLTGAQQVEQIIKKCTSPLRDKVFSSVEMRRYNMEEIDCKKKAILTRIEDIIPNNQDRAQLIQHLKTYLDAYGDFYFDLLNKNITCLTSDGRLDCGTIPIMLPSFMQNEQLDQILRHIYDIRAAYGALPDTMIENQLQHVLSQLDNADR